MKSYIIFPVFLFVFMLLIPTLTNGQSRCLQEAWRLYNNAEIAYSNGNTRTASDGFIAAIQPCNLCITQFGDTAIAMQKEYGNNCPPVGVVTEAERREIFSRWALNDVATACFIKGKAADYLLRMDSVKHSVRKKDLQNAQNLLRQLSKGRCWDPPPNGWFWSPCQGLLGGGPCCQ